MDFINDKLISKTLVQEFIALLPLNASILDVCCGIDGSGILNKLAKMQFHVTGIDISTRPLQYIRELHSSNPDYPYLKHINFCAQDVRALGFKSPCFHGLTAVYALDYFSPSEFSDLFKSFSEFLLPRGILLLSCGFNSKMYDELGSAERFIHSTLETMRTTGFSVLKTKFQPVSPYYWILGRKPN